MHVPSIVVARNERGESELGEYLKFLARKRLSGTYEATDLLDSLKTLKSIRDHGRPQRVVHEAVHLHAHRHEQHVVAYAYSITTLPRPDPIVVLNGFEERSDEPGPRPRRGAGPLRVQGGRLVRTVAFAAQGLCGTRKEQAMKHYAPDPARLAGGLESLEQDLLRDDAAFRLEWVERSAGRMAAQLASLTQEMRREAGLSQTELARKLGISQPVVARLESRDPQRLPTFDTVAKLAAACGRRMVIRFEPVGGDTEEPHGRV